MTYAVYTRRTSEHPYSYRGSYTTMALAENARRLYRLIGYAVSICPCAVFTRREDQ